MRQVLLNALAYAGMVMLTGCYYDNEEELYGIQQCDILEARFEQVQEILVQNCVSCHNPSIQNGGVDLEGYNVVKRYADDGRLLGVINHRTGYAPMPKNGPKLLECDIATITKWIEDGALNN